MRSIFFLSQMSVFGGMNLLRSSLKATVEEPPKDCIGSL